MDPYKAKHSRREQYVGQSYYCPICRKTIFTIHHHHSTIGYVGSHR